MKPHKIMIVAACVLAAAGCGKKDDLPTPVPTMHDYMKRMAGQWLMHGQTVYQCWLCAPPTYETTNITKRINVYLMDDTTISVVDTIDPGNAKVMYLQQYDTAARSLSFVSPDNGMYGHSFVNFYIQNDSIVYDSYSQSSGSSREDIVHAP